MNLYKILKENNITAEQLGDFLIGITKEFTATQVKLQKQLKLLKKQAKKKKSG